MALSEKLRACAERLAHRPGDPEAVAVLEGLLEAPAERVEAARFLAPAYERAGNDDGLARVLGLIAADAEALPDRLQSLEQLKKLHERRGAWAALAEVIEKLAWVEPDAGRQREAWRAAALLHLGRLHDEETGLECWLRVLALAPADAQARAEVRALSDRPLSGAAAALCAEIVAKSKGQPEAQALLDRLLPPTEALLAALRSFQTAAEPSALLENLHAVAVRADALDEVADVVEAQSEEVENPAQVTALLRFAARVREELGEPQKARVLWNDLLAGAPRDAEALEHLARLLGEQGDSKHAGELSVRRAELAPAGPSRLEHFVDAADYFLIAGAHESALTAFNEALRAAGPAVPMEVIAHVQLERGRLLERAGDPAAVGAFSQALDVEAFAAGAAEGLERLMGKPMTRIAAARALEPWVRRAGSPKRLAAVLAVRAEQAASTEQHLEYLLELAALNRQLGEPRSALGALIRAFALAPRDERVGPEMEQLAYGLGANEELLAAYEEHLERNPSDAEVARKTAQLHDVLGNRDEAFAAWERAAQAAPRDVQLLEAFAEKVRARGDLARLGKVLRWQADASSDAAAKAKALRALAQLCEDSLADPAGAAHAWEELLALQPGDTSLLKTLERLYEHTHQVAKLAGVVARELDRERLAAGPGVAALALKLARLKLEAPADEAGALELLREVLQLEPDNAQAVAALGRLASTPSPLQAEAAALASTALDELGDYPIVVQILEAQLGTTSGGAARAAILHRISDLQAGPLADEDLAFLAITRALREAPHDAGILARCIELADATGAGDELEALLGELASAQVPVAARAGLFRALARRQDSALAALDGPLTPALSPLRGEGGAVASWSEVLRLVPGDVEAFGRLAALFEASGRLADLAVLQRQRAESASPQERPAALLALAAAQERAGQLEEAASTLLGLFALKPGVEALTPLDRVLGALGRHLERAEVLRRLANETSDEKLRVSRLLAQARALLTAKEPARAAGVLGEILERAPDEPRAIAELVSLVGEPSAGEHARQLLGQAFKGLGLERQRASVLEALVVVTDERALRHELAGLHEALGELTQAYAGRLRLVRERPGDTEARVALEQLARQAHLEEELVEAYDELLEGNVDAAAGLSMRETIARLYAGELKRPDLAVRAWEKVAKLDRQALAPLNALEELHREAKDWVRLAGVLQRKAPLLATAAEQAEVLCQLAALAEGPLHDKGLTAETYRAILERVPGDAAALRALGGLLDGLGKHAEAYAVLSQQLEVAASDDERTSLRLRLGQLAAGPLGKPAEAVDHFAAVGAVEELEKLLSQTPLRARVAAVLEPVYRTRGATQQLADMLELQPPTPERLEELAMLREGLKQLQQAFAARQRLYSMKPEDAAARAAFERVATATGQLETLASMFHARLEHRLDEAEVLELWRRLGAVHQQLGQRRAAAEALEQVAKRTPMDPQPLAVLCELYRAEAVWPKLPGLLRMRAELATDVHEQVALLLELASVAEEKLSDDAAAIDACRAAIERGGSGTAAQASLERLLEKSGRFAELRELLLERGEDPAVQLRVALLEYRSLKEDDAALKRLSTLNDASQALREIMRGDRPSAAQAARLVEASADAALRVEALEVQAEWASAAERTSLLHRIADLHQTDAIRQFEALDRLLRDAPNDERALQRLEPLAVAAKFERALARLLGDVVSTASAATQRIIWPKLARLRQGLGELDGALAAWRSFLELEPRDEAALIAASELTEKAQAWGELVDLLERRLKLAPTDDDRAVLLGRIGAVQSDRIADAASAYHTYRRLLELRPGDATALERLDGLCEALERWPELAEVLGRRIALEGSDGIALRLRLARVRRSRLQSSAGALPLLGEILQADPRHDGALKELEELVAEQPGWEPPEDLLLGAHRRSKDSAKLSLLLDAAASRGLKGGRRRVLWLELAELRLTHQQDPSLAFLAMARAFRETPGDDLLRERLVDLAAAANEHEALGALLDEVMPQLDPGKTAEASLTLGQLCLGPLDEPARAVMLFRKARELEPSTASRALEGLDAALERLEDWDALLPVLEERLAAAPTVDLHLRLGAVAADHLGRDEQAIAAYRAVLHEQPRHLEAARALEVLYERTGHRTALLEILTLLEGLLWGVQRAQVRMKMARLCVKDDYERTLVLCRKLLEEDPLHVEAFALLSERLESGGRWGELDTLLEQRLAVTIAPQEAAELGFRLGELAFRRRDDAKKAAKHYRGVLERAPRHLGALEALEELYEGSGEKRELARVLATLAAVREDADQRRAHHLRRAEVLAELNERDAAIAAVQATLGVTAARPAAVPARNVLQPDKRWQSATEPSYRPTEPDFPALTAVTEPELQRLRKLTLKLEALPEASQTLSLLAEHQARVGRGPEAISTFFELADVDERRSEGAGATRAVERILALDPANRAAYDRARKLYRPAQPREWAALTARYLPHLQGLELLVALDGLTATHAEQLRDPAGAFGFASKAVTLDPGSDERRATAEALATRLKKLDVLAATWRDTLAQLPFGPSYAALALALARIEDSSLNQVDAAESTLKGLLAHDPVNAAALDALAAMFERRGLHARLAAALELKLEAGADAAALLPRLALLHEQQLKDPAAAAHALRRLVDAAPEPAHARLLVALHQRHQQWPGMLNALLRVRTLASAGAERAKVQLEIAALHEQQLQDPEAAVGAYLHALELAPSSAPAFRSLEKLYLKLDRPAELLRAYEQRIARTSSTDEKIDLEYKSADLWERRGNPLAADKCLDAVVALKGDELKALEGLQRLRRAGARWRPLAEAVQKHAAVAAQPLQRAQLLTELGQVQLEHLEESPAAASSWAKALEQLAEHRPALRLLAELHEKEKRWADAAALIGREAKLEKAPAVRAELEHRRGTLYEDQLEDMAAARAAYASALEAEAVHLPSLRRLRGIFFRAGEWPAYEANLAHEAKRAPEAGDRYAAALELARHYHKARERGQTVPPVAEGRGSASRSPAGGVAPHPGPLPSGGEGGAAAAVTWYEHAFATKADSLDAALPLCDLLVAARSWPRAAEVLAKTVTLLEKEKPPRTRPLIDRLCELAAAHRELQQPSLAVHAYARALHLDPTEPKALRAQIDMLEGGGHIAEAADKLELFLEHHLQSVPRAERASLALHLGEMHWKLKREKDALAAAERSLDVEPVSSAALALAIKAADKLELHEKAVALKQRLADASADEQRFKLLLELSVQAHEKLNNPARAIEALLVAQKLKPDSRAVLQQLAAGFRAVGHNRKAADTVQQLLQHPETTAADRRKETLALADLYGRAMGEVDRAIDVLEKALDQNPGFVEAFQAVEALLTRTREWKKLDAIYSRMAQRLGAGADSGPARAALWRATGELRLKQFKDRAGALAAFEAGVKLTPDDAPALEAYAALAIEFPDRVDAALKAYLRALPKSLDPQRACAAFARIAEKRGDLDTASIATRAAAMLSVGGTQAGIAPPRFRAPVSEQLWRELLLHPGARGPLGELMALVWEHAGGRYAQGLSDHKLHAKKHAVDPRAATHEAVRHLYAVGKALGLPPLEVLSPYLAPQSSSRREPHPDDAVGVKVVPTWPPYVVIGERLTAEKNLSSLYALIARGLAQLRPELMMPQLLDGDALELMVEAALSLGDGRYLSPVDPKVLKADRKQLEKGFSSDARTTLSIVTEKVLGERREGDLARFREAARLTPLRAALLVAGDFAPVRAQISFEGEHADAAIRELLVFALGGELHQLRVETGTQVGAR